jgi:hypothetical protein
MQQLLFLEAVIKAAIGVLLMIAPGVVLKILGLPVVPTGFWPRLFGATLVGIAGANVIEGTLLASRGLGLAGSLVINFAIAAMLTIQLAVNAAAETLRGKLLLWLLAACFYVLILVEIAHVQ